ncbi:carboxylate-amine ligase [Egicoccus halophilus]|uniref:Putative glutamate--cysteine ligase 2 n=1 Tax=Egicoccus halophilus TaxID=1670830 RepID=A0A8J3EVA8_9ACTN|nr:glutamate--cysteine ligase [Egicoccus halophilus]GGI07744.1 putative glutamate--cysteine ligase 2-2 [Egicoccus halophilus]
MAGTERLTVGAEEEYHLVDADRGVLVSAADAVLEHLDHEAYEHELQRSMVETHSGVHVALGDLRADLAARRRALRTVADAHGASLVASGTVPLSDWREQRMSGDERYQRLRAEHGTLAEEQIVCGCHVHVGVPDRATALQVVPHVLPWLPVLLALSSSSPFWQGLDTGYASFRTPLWGRWPTAGFPPTLTDVAAYERLAASLVETGTVIDRKQLYWFVRPSEQFPTLEFRVADACTRLDETVLQAALCRGLVATALERLERGVDAPEPPPALLDAALWRASRSGLGDQLIDPVGAVCVPAPELVRRLVDELAGALDRHGDLDLVHDHVQRMLVEGTSAERQRAAVAVRGRLEDAVARLVQETDPDGAGAA